LIEELDTAKLEGLRAKRLEVQARNLEAAQLCLRSAGYKFETKDDMLILNETHAIERPDDLARILVNAGVHPTRIAVEQQDLEEHFLQLTGGLRE
jgi:ABC-2 type transport system ATP-binding protein